MPPLPALLMEELVEEVLFRLPPDEPAWLVRASAVCKQWRRIVADPGFRRRYREFHGTPPVLGFFDGDDTFVPTSALLPAQPDRPCAPRCIPLDCRHGRVLFATSSEDRPAFDLIVLDPLKSYQCRVPFPVDHRLIFSAAVLCATQGCDHHGCEEGHFLVVVLTTSWLDRVTSGWLYSSATRAWSDLTSVHHPNVQCRSHFAKRSVLVGDALYFNVDGAIIKYQLGMLRLSMFKKPINCGGRLMKTQDGRLAFATVVKATNLILWSIDTGPDGAMGIAKLRVIDLKTLLPDGALSTPTPRWTGAYILSGFTEGAQVTFVSTCAGVYMVDLKSRRARKVSCDSSHGQRCFPYMNFYIPAMKAASTIQEQ
ncbi:unnamed protein product [Alopecurus aequalis]